MFSTQKNVSLFFSFAQPTNKKKTWHNQNKDLQAFNHAGKYEDNFSKQKFSSEFDWNANLMPKVMSIIETIFRLNHAKRRSTWTVNELGKIDEKEKKAKRHSKTRLSFFFFPLAVKNLILSHFFFLSFLPFHNRLKWIGEIFHFNWWNKSTPTNSVKSFFFLFFPSILKRNCWYEEERTFCL